jgi:alkanesulfonate monooxygenase SsuD/methylene tetrahydromethanopterin reductase-like flavin-dependent oxidoreductase (luciferase family)
MAGCGRGRVIAHPATTHFRSPQVKLTTPQQALAQYPREAVFPLKAEVGAALLELDQRNVAGEGRRPANVNRALPINFCGGPDEIVAQLKQCREQIGAGVVDLSFQTPGSEDPDELMEALELFGKKVLPQIRDI